ncbi:hypothetical protein C2S53_012962, partial [Perilla frutescens var. hirtella]
MCSNFIVSSGESEKRWVLAMKKNFPEDHILNIDFKSSYCVFKTKSEAYAPHQLGLGPLHHLRPHLYTAMQKQKLAAITELLPPQKLQNFHLVVDALLPLEPVVRACYDQYLDLDIETLAWIFAIDGVYLLHFLKNYPETKHLAGDVMMLENQIPFVLLNKVVDVLELNRSSLFENLQAFLQDQSPLELMNSRNTDNDAHLLHRMYNLIVNKNIAVSHFGTYSLGVTISLLDDVAESVQFLADRGLPGAGTAGQILSFVKKIPWGKMMLKKNEETPSSSAASADEIDIPSVSQMAEIAGIKFILTNGGIGDIRFDDQEKEFHLPSIKLSATSEIVLRNLVAYEAAASAQTGELAEYVDLMCGIIDSGKDVDILRKEGIIVQSDELDDDEIAGIFNGISKSEKKKKTEDRSNVEEAVEEVNKRYSSLVRVKVGKMVEKYGYACFKLLSVLITIAVLLLLTLQAFCSVFGCAPWFLPKS